MSEILKIHHDVADIQIKPSGRVNKVRLKKMIRLTLDQYLIENRVPAKTIRDETREQHGDYYHTPGHYLRLYRRRTDMTQEELASATGIRQHHISEMENNKRVLGKGNARKLAKVLDCDYRKLL